MRSLFFRLFLYGAISACCAFSSLADEEVEVPPSVQVIYNERFINTFIDAICGSHIVMDRTFYWDSFNGGYAIEYASYDNCFRTNYPGANWWNRKDSEWDVSGSGTAEYWATSGLVHTASEWGPLDYLTLQRVDVIDIDYLQDGPNQDVDDFDRYVTTTLILHTGGKQSVSRNNLFTTSAEATEVLDPRWYYPAPGQIPGTQGISPTSITIRDGNLGSDGRRFFTFDDNAEYDITPTTSSAASGLYVFNFNFIKHKLIISANGVALDIDIPNKEFCVGAKVTHSYAFSPPVSSVTSYVQNWTLGGSWINRKSIDLESECTTYSVEASDLSTLAPVAWWYDGTYDGQTLSSSVGVNLAFANGQYRSVASVGKFKMHRPSISMSSIQSPRWFSKTWIAPGIWKLKYGDPGTLLGSMNFAVRINTRYAGTGVAVQLCKLDYNALGFNFTDYRLDGSDVFYEGPVTISPGSISTIDLQDQPESTRILDIRVKGDFIDFFQFKPPGVDSIYVTLGKCTWSMHGELQNIAGEATIVGSSTPSPNGPNSSTEFPFWLYKRED